MNSYTDEELRLIALPLAIKMVDQEVYRTIGRCNTNEINNVVTEFVNIIKYNSVTAPTTAEEEPKVVEGEVLPPAAKFA